MRSEVRVWIKRIEGISERDLSPEDRWHVEEGDLGRAPGSWDNVRSRHARGFGGVGEETILQGLGRIRDIRESPDGYIYVAGRDGPTSVVRLEPAGAR